MLGIGRKKLPDPSTNTEYSGQQDYLAQAMGATQEPTKKKKVKLDSGGQPSRGVQKLA